LQIRHWQRNIPLEFKAVDRVWSEEGFSCDHWVDPPGRQWLDFVHDSDERVVVKSGRIEFEVEGSRAMLGPGDEVFISAGSRHSVWNRSSSTARWFYGYRQG